MSTTSIAQFHQAYPPEFDGNIRPDTPIDQRLLVLVLRELIARTARLPEPTAAEPGQLIERLQNMAHGQVCVDWSACAEATAELNRLTARVAELDQECNASMVEIACVRERAERAEVRVERLEKVQFIDPTDKIVSYVLRYGGLCRECADRDGICSSGLPCDPGYARRVVRHVIDAVNYGLAHKYIARAALEDKGL